MASDRAPRRPPPPRHVRRAARLALLAAALPLTAACSDDDSVHAIETTRDVAGAPDPALGSAERFGMTGGMPPATGGAAAPFASAPAGFAWDVPAGWTELPARPPRAGSLQAPGGVDCSITALPGAAGGLVANVNRWRAQMNLAPWSDAEIAALPTAAMLGGRAVRVELTGDYSGMGDEPTTAAAALLGYVLSEPSRTVFVKMVGPADAVRAQGDALAALVASLRAAPGAGATASAPRPASDPHAGTDPHAALDPRASGAPADPHAGLSGQADSFARSANDPLGLSWDAPAGWERGPERSMRVVTYSPAESPEVECYVVVLGGSGGGLVQNVNLWRQQMGLPPLDVGDPTHAETLEVLGRGAPLVELSGAGAAAGRSMLAIMCGLPTHAVFVKMTGPAEAVARQRDAFVAFCESLEQ